MIVSLKFCVHVPLHVYLNYFVLRLACTELASFHIKFQIMVRFRNRYFLCHIDAEHENKAIVCKLTGLNILNAVRSSIAQNFGDLAMGQVSSSLACKLWSPALSLCLIRCERSFFRTAWAAITLLTTVHAPVDVGNIRITVIHIGGTIRSCQKPAFAQARQLILEAHSLRTETSGLEIAFASMKRDIEKEDI